MLTPKIIIEGANLSGKTSVAEGLEKSYVHSVMITLHGYYHPNFLRINPDTKKAISYHNDRLRAFVPVIEKVTAEELIFNRFHLTAAVYMKLFYNQEEHFFEIEKILNQLNVYLFLIDFNDEALEIRAKDRLASGKESPWGDDDLAMSRKKRDLYRYFFDNSLMRNKYLIDNSKPPIDRTIKNISKIIKN